MQAFLLQNMNDQALLFACKHNLPSGAISLSLTKPEAGVLIQLQLLLAEICLSVCICGSAAARISLSRLHGLVVMPDVSASRVLLPDTYSLI